MIRAFVRERREAERFEVANTNLFEASLRTGLLMALMFPVVMLVMNATSVSVQWFGARRIDVGQGEPSWVVLADVEGNEFCVLREA